MTIERIAIVNREQWLSLRKKDVTASVEPALHGLHPYTSALRLYIEKQGLVELPQLPNSGPLRRGRILESAVAAAVADQKPHWKLTKANEYWRDPDIRLGCTPDFYIKDSEIRERRGILQCKTAAPSVFEREWNGKTELAGPPMWVMLQITTEMMLTNADFGAIAVLVVDPHELPCHIFEVPRHEAAEKRIRQAVVQFWQDIRDGKEPDADYGMDKELIAALVPRESNAKTIDLSTDNEVISGLAERADLKRTIKMATERCSEVEAMIMDRMRDAAVAIVPDFSVTWKVQNRRGYTVEPSTPRVLLIREQRGR
jgi:predicted phage-related endonuclease